MEARLQWLATSTPCQQRMQSLISFAHCVSRGQLGLNNNKNVNIGVMEQKMKIAGIIGIMLVIAVIFNNSSIIGRAELQRSNRRLGIPGTSSTSCW